MYIVHRFAAAFVCKEDGFQNALTPKLFFEEVIELWKFSFKSSKINANNYLYC